MMLPACLLAVVLAASGPAAFADVVSGNLAGPSSGFDDLAFPPPPGAVVEPVPGAGAGGEGEAPSAAPSGDAAQGLVVSGTEDVIRQLHDREAAMPAHVRAEPIGDPVHRKRWIAAGALALVVAAAVWWRLVRRARLSKRRRRVPLRRYPVPGAVVLGGDAGVADGQLPERGRGEVGL